MAHSLGAGADRKLLTRAERDAGYFYEHKINDMLRGDIAARTKAFQTQFLYGALNDDEWREAEGRNPLPDEQGQKFFVAANVVPIEKAGQAPPGGKRPPIPGKQPPDQGDAGDSPDKEELENGIQTLLRAGVRSGAGRDLGRMIRKEAQAARRASRQPGKFLAWIDEFYSRHALTLAEALGPALRVHAALHRLTEDPEASARRVAGELATVFAQQLLGLAGDATAATLEASGQQAGQPLGDRMAGGAGGPNPGGEGMEARLIRGDCLKVLPRLSGIDAVVCDPPYGIGYQRHGPGGLGLHARRNLDPIIGDDRCSSTLHHGCSSLSFSSGEPITFGIDCRPAAPCSHGTNQAHGVRETASSMVNSPGRIGAAKGMCSVTSGKALTATRASRPTKAADAISPDKSPSL